jgi:hypothetical protein
VALVDHPREATGAGEDGQQWDLGQRDGRGEVVDEDDLVTGQRQLVAAARRRAVDGRDPDLAGALRGVLDAVAGLVGELAEVDLVVVRRPGQHLDVRPRAEDLVDAAGQDDRVHLGVLEPEPLDRVGQLDVDRQVVGVELELVVVPQTALGIDRHGQGGYRAVDGQPPVPVALRRGLELHGRNGRHPIAHGDPQSLPRSSSQGHATTVDSSAERV